MLPTKGYFQDIECPYYDSCCGRPYCHFRHRKKATEIIEESVSEPEKDEIAVIPTYKPTPKSELANIHNKSHIPISYVPDLAFRPDRKSRPLPKFEKPTYKPTPLSILSSANKRSSISEENGEHTKAIKEIKQNIANVEYNPAISLQPTSDIDFEDLSTEFDLIDEIINSSDKGPLNTPLRVNEVNNVINENRSDVLNEHSDDQSKVLNETPAKQPDLKLGTFKPEEKQDERKNKQKLSGEKILKSEKHDKREKHSDRDSDKKEKHSEKQSKTGDRADKYSDKKEKYAEKSFDKSCKDSEKKIKNGEKHVKGEKSRQNKHEKGSERYEKNEKPKHKLKERTEKTSEKIKSSEKDKISDREKYTSSKVKCITEKNEKSEKSSKSNSSRDKHRKEEKKDRHKEEKHSSHKSKHKSKDRSRSRSKERRKDSGDREKTDKDKKHCDKNHKSKSKYKDKHRDSDQHREKSHKTSSKEKREDERKMHLEETSNDSDVALSNNFEPNSSDLDLDDEDETMLECYKIFNEYRPPQRSALQPESEKMLIDEDFFSNRQEDNNVGKKRIAHANVESTVTYSQLHPPNKPKAVFTPGQTLTNRYRIAKLAQASREQEFIMNEIKQPSVPTKRPAPTLLEAAREHKLRKEHLQYTPTHPSCLVDDIIKGASKPNVSQPKITPIKKIAPAQNVGLMEKAKERISKIKQTQIKTIAQTKKTGRVAHVPEVSLSDIPDVLQAEKSKLPVNVRTRFLTMLADECVKLYISKKEAFARALNEEFSCYEKCKVLATYRNSAMLAVNRLRKEILEREKLGLGFIGLGEDPGKDPSSEFSGRTFYNNVVKWILTEEELDIHGYPREIEDHHGRVVIKNRKNLAPTNLDENQRMCSRCHKIYQVDDDGWPLFEEECLYHPLKKRTIRGEQTYLCCRSNDSMGCATSDTHVSEAMNDAELDGYQTTMDPEYEDDPRSTAVYALDCEMCYTTKGLELTRVTIVDTECKTVYESLVKPLNPIIDYNTRFSGITKEQMDKTSTSILQIQANILHLCNSKTILVGHSLESDMKALKIVHGTVIDTSVLFPHKMGLPHKRALKALASELLRKIIQNDISGHDSAEDAVTCMELIKWKLKDELKVRGSK